jgi:tetratricopeptide (TPR) repeat protein
MEESLFYCDSSLTYNENHKPLLRKKAVLLFTDHEYLQAEPILKQLLSLGDSTFLTLKYAGICNALQKKYDLAIVLLRKAHKMQKNDIEVMLHLASSLSNKPDFFDETLEVIAEIRKNIEPDSAIIYQTCTLLAQSYLSVKDTLNAVRQYYVSMNVENKDDRLLRMTHLANKVKPETSNTLLWYVHYYFLQNFEQVSEDHWNYTYQKEFSQSLLRKYIEYMHMAGKQKVIWNTFTKKTITLTMKDLQKLVK